MTIVPPSAADNTQQKDECWSIRQVWPMATVRRYNLEPHTTFSASMTAGPGAGKRVATPRRNFTCIAAEPRLPSIPVRNDETLSMNASR